MKTFLYYGSEHDNGDDGCNDENVYNVYLLSFLHDNESNRVNFQEFLSQGLLSMLPYN